MEGGWQLCQGLKRVPLAFARVQTPHSPHQKHVLRQLQSQRLSRFVLVDGLRGEPPFVKGKGQHVATALRHGGFGNALCLEPIKSSHPSVHAAVSHPMPGHVFGPRDLHGLLHDKCGTKRIGQMSAPIQISTVTNPNDVRLPSTRPGPRMLLATRLRNRRRGNQGESPIQSLLPCEGSHGQNHINVVSGLTHPASHDQHVALQTTPTIRRGEKAYVLVGQCFVRCL